MRLHRHSQLGWVLRAGAGVTLTLWFMAHMLCFAQCHFRGEPCDTPKSSCHQAVDGASCSKQAGDSQPSGTPVCATCLISTLVPPSADGVTIAAPENSLLYTLAPAANTDSARLNLTADIVVSHARSLDWLFTPEVSLGPAFRSHAPPILG